MPDGAAIGLVPSSNCRSSGRRRHQVRFSVILASLYRYPVESRPAGLAGRIVRGMAVDRIRRRGLGVHAIPTWW